jgi:hypothetical protein
MLRENTDVLARFGVLVPGIRSLSMGVERHKVKGGGTVVPALKQADQLAVCDREGQQRCELVDFGISGRCDGQQKRPRS